MVFQQFVICSKETVKSKFLFFAKSCTYSSFACVSNEIRICIDGTSLAVLLRRIYSRAGMLRNQWQIFCNVLK